MLGSPGGDRVMTYDAVDRLLTVTNTTGYGGNGRWVYDPLDNLREADQGARQLRYNYGSDWRLATVKTPGGITLNTFGYDARGNILARNPGTDTFTFDRANRMLTASLGNSSYQYDGLGRRVRETSNGAASWYQYSRSGQLLFTDDAKTSRTHAYIYLSGSLVAKRTTPYSGAAQVNYQHTDALGSLVAASDGAGTVGRRERMTAYGEPADGVFDNGHGFAGHQNDAATNLVYMQQRYYDPRIGRFLSVDPIGSDESTGANFNRYWYADNNPISKVDPDGRIACRSISQCYGVQTIQLSPGSGALRGGKVAGDMSQDFSDEVAPGQQIRDNVRKTESVDSSGVKRLLIEVALTMSSGDGVPDSVTKQYIEEINRVWNTILVGSDKLVRQFVLDLTFSETMGDLELVTCDQCKGYGAALVGGRTHYYVPGYLPTTPGHEMGHTLGFVGHARFGTGRLMSRDVYRALTAEEFDLLWKAYD